MEIKNIMEDIVSSSVEQVLKKEKTLPDSKEYIEDISAYVLNRVEPRYVTSERGILHGVISTRLHVQEKTDILLLIHEAIDVIKTRRSNPEGHIGIVEKEVCCYLPHILGEVVEESTFSKISDVHVTLLYEGKPAEMMGDGWQNPYVTNKGTQSYYHFWPKFIGDPTLDKEYSFTLRFEHDKCNVKEYSFSVKAEKGFTTTFSKSIPIVLLSVKEGEGSSFLYE